MIRVTNNKFSGRNDLFIGKLVNLTTSIDKYIYIPLVQNKTCITI
jgi:hypothetical protein